ncbi:Predicted ATPase [[Clostridium] sordellii]|nr:Predicted ATPase [[Clostridium] sordellii] [Paeniclostridium sordellii]
MPSELIIDSSKHTCLEKEFLLNKNGDLQIHKIVKATSNSNLKVSSTKIIANYPENCKNVHILKRDQLKALAKQHEIEVSDNRVSSYYRISILNKYSNEELKEIEIETKSEGGKDIWEGIKKYLPIYSLFQSDRKNQDKDGEVQDPMKEAVKEVLSQPEIVSILDNISERVTSAVNDVSERTLKELQNINPDIAKELKPEAPKKIEWDKIFTFGLNSDNGVPLNKRGSGVRRMILLSFFKAQAQKRKEYSNNVDIIYALEEPETAQHPYYQQLLIESLINLSNDNNTQIVFTTHSPELCNMIPRNSLRFIDKSNEYKIFKTPTNDIIEKIVSNLGILPSISSDIEKNVRKVQVALCVEGPTDVSFFKNINTNISELKNIVDLNDERIIIIPMGGSTLKAWVNNRYLDKLEINQVHVYDSDLGSKTQHKYKDEIENLNKQTTCKAYETELREIENYIHSSIFSSEAGICFENQHLNMWNTLDIGEYCAKYKYDCNCDTEKKWNDLTDKKQSEKIRKEKKLINEDYSKLMTKELFEDMERYEEVKKWFDSIAFFLEN